MPKHSTIEPIDIEQNMKKKKARKEIWPAKGMTVIYRNAGAQKMGVSIYWWKINLDSIYHIVALK